MDELAWISIGHKRKNPIEPDYGRWQSYWVSRRCQHGNSRHYNGQNGYEEHHLDSQCQIHVRWYQGLLSWDTRGKIWMYASSNCANSTWNSRRIKPNTIGPHWPRLPRNTMGYIQITAGRYSGKSIADDQTVGATRLLPMSSYTRPAVEAQMAPHHVFTGGGQFWSKIGGQRTGRSSNC
jgi:hypothetical protein